MNANDATTEILHIRVPRTLREQIDNLAQATGQDQSQLAAHALGEYVTFEAEQLAKIHEGLNAADAGEFATDEEMDETFNRYRAYRAEQAG